VAWHKFKSVGFILANKYEKLETKKDALESRIFPVLLDGIRTWSLMAKEKRMLQTCQQKMEHAILQVVWSGKVTNAEERQRTNVKDILTVAHSLESKCGGHVARMDQFRWAHGTSMWDVQIGTRRTG
jgi:hypothetical protein